MSGSEYTTQVAVRCGAVTFSAFLSAEGVATGTVGMLLDVLVCDISQLGSFSGFVDVTRLGNGRAAAKGLGCGLVLMTPSRVTLGGIQYSGVTITDEVRTENHSPALVGTLDKPLAAELALGELVSLGWGQRESTLEGGVTTDTALVVMPLGDRARPGGGGNAGMASSSGSDKRVTAVEFDMSPSGVPEADPEWVHAHLDQVRIVDVRTRTELAMGHIAGAMWVPLGEIGEALAEWTPREPIVFVCRSGRRSARAVAKANACGFTTTASMTGGMVLWTHMSLPVIMTKIPARERKIEMSASLDAIAKLPEMTPDALQVRLKHANVRWMRAAALLLHGTNSCVDGREATAVIGTPGGDAGELLLSLATIEAVTGEELGQGDVDQIFEKYVAGFGRFYIHTDEAAMVRLGESLTADPAFAGHAFHSVADVEAFVRQPPIKLRPALLAMLFEPAHIGCGHLKLVTLHPEQYQVRPEVIRNLIAVVFTHLWEAPEMIDYVVLYGAHEEKAVVNIHLPGTVNPFSNVPALAPNMGNVSIFVNHPEVAAFVRSQSAMFMFERVPRLEGSGVSRDHFLEAVADRANLQLTATVEHLASTLPVYDVDMTVDGDIQVRS